VFGIQKLLHQRATESYVKVEAVLKGITTVVSAGTPTIDAAGVVMVTVDE
jgi:hypothetical protein